MIDHGELSVCKNKSKTINLNKTIDFTYLIKINNLKIII